MRMLLQVNIPHRTFNAAVKDGTVGSKIHSILDATKPEMVFFTELKGVRAALMIVDVEKASQIPSFAEPWFLTFEAEVQLSPIMSPEDLAAGGLDVLGKKWG